DMPGSTDARLSVQLPADGAYQIIVTDSAGVAPTPLSIYRLSLERQPEDFRLDTAPVLNAPIGDKTNLTVNVTREGGLKEPIEVRVLGLPKGVSVPEKLVAVPGAPSLAVPFALDKTVAAGAGFITIEGSAKIGGKVVTRTATVPLAGDLAPRDP